MRINPINAIDFYKSGHIYQYPKGTTKVYSNLTPRSLKLAPLPNVDADTKVVFFGLQHFLHSFLIETFNSQFFHQNKEMVLLAYQRRMTNALGPNVVSLDHIAALHDLGYLPIKIKALEEGSRVPVRVPMLTITNTLPEFFWLVNYLETILSCMVWKPCTSATIAYEYKKLLLKYADDTGSPRDFTNFQGHDFSFRGLSGIEDAALSGAAHLTSFWGTDTVPAIDFVEQYYGADSDKEPIGFSVPATEHSVMCMGGQEDEIGTFTRLITELYPQGIVSIVSDTWDFWKVIGTYATALKPEILARPGKVVFRPDSGDPVKIICGDPTRALDELPRRGAVEALWDIFGGTVNEAGFKVLDPHVGLIYGDSITLERAEAILEGLKAKGFASSNIVFGIGSFTYQYVTRDSFGFAVKSTYGEIDGVGRDIFKSPKTDNGTKNSATGLLRVEEVDGELTLFEKQTNEEEQKGLLREVFVDGQLFNTQTLADVRKKLMGA